MIHASLVNNSNVENMKEERDIEGQQLKQIERQAGNVVQSDQIQLGQEESQSDLEMKTEETRQEREKRKLENPDNPPAKIAKVSEKDTERSRSGSELSHQSTVGSQKSSEVQIESHKTDKIIVSNKIDASNPTLLEIKFFINSEQRPDTNIRGGGQGDHTTSYTAIIQALLETVNDEGIKNAIELVHNFGKSILMDNDERDRFKKIEHPEVLSNEQRHNVKKALDGTDQKELSTPASDMLKYAKVAILANHLCNITSDLLTTIQKEETTTFYSQGRIGKSKSEGDEAKGAARALVALDSLCKLCNLEGKEFEEELASFELSLAPNKKGSEDTEDDHIIRYGLNRLSKDGGIELEKKIKKMSVDQKKDCLKKTRDDLLLKPEIIAGFIGNLLDYNMTIKFDLSESEDISLTNEEKNGSFKDQVINLIKVFEALENKTFIDPNNKDILKQKLAAQFGLTSTNIKLAEQLKLKIANKASTAEFEKFIGANSIESRLQGIVEIDEFNPLKMYKDQKIGLTTQEQKQEIEKRAEIVGFRSASHIYSHSEDTIRKKDKDVKISVLEITRTNEEKLLEVLDKHLKIIIATIPNLKMELEKPQNTEPTFTTATTSNRFDQLINIFLEQEVLQKQGWKEMQRIDLIANTAKPLSVGYLREKINQSTNQDQTKTK